MSETICIPKQEYIRMKKELSMFKNTELYRRLLEFENNIKEGKVYTRKDLGF